MAFTWEVVSTSGNEKLILKDGETTVAEITGLGTSLVGDIWPNLTTEGLEDGGWLEFTEATVDGSGNVTTPGTIKLKKKAFLNKDGTANATISLTLKDYSESSGTDYSGYYQLAIDGADNTGLLGGEELAEKWGVSDGTTGLKKATYYDKGTAAKWQLGNSADGKVNDQITYTAEAQNTVLVEIDGLIGGLTDQGEASNPLNLNGSNPPITIEDAPTGSSFTELAVVKAAALPLSPNAGTSTVSLTTNTNSAYGLDMAADVVEFDETPGDPKVISYTSGTATIGRSQSAGWKESEESAKVGKEFTYTAETNKDLATLSNLATNLEIPTDGANKGKLGKTETVDGKSVFTELVTVNNNVVTLKKDALVSVDPATTPATTPSAVTITDATGIDSEAATRKNFTLRLDTTQTNSENKPTIGFEQQPARWELDSTTTPNTAKYYQEYKKEGWTLNTSTNITYTAQEADAILATITNLNSNAAVKDGKIGTYATANDPTTAFTEGITVNTTTNKITLSKAVLTTNNDAVMTLTNQQNRDNQTQAFQLAKNTSEDIPDYDTVPTSFTLDELKTDTENTRYESDFKQITIKGTKQGGWTISNSATGKVNDQITYKRTATEDLATIHNLSKDVTAGNNEGEFGVNVTENGTTKFVKAITLTNNANAAKTVTINAAALTQHENKESKVAQGTEGEEGYVAAQAAEDNATTLTLTTVGTTYKTENDKIDFNLVKGTDAVAPGTTPIDIKLDHLEDVKETVNSVADTLVSKTLQVVGTMTKGWTLDTADGATKNKKISYTAETTPVLANITNLSPGVVEKSETVSGVTTKKYGTNTGESDAFVEGITLGSDGTITLKEAVLSKVEDVQADTTSDPQVAFKNNSTTVTTTGAITAHTTQYKFAISNLTAPASALSNIRLANFDNPDKTGGETGKDKTQKKIDVVGTLAAGWTLGNADSGTNNKVTYTAATDHTIATVKGLNKDESFTVGTTEETANTFGTDDSGEWKAAISLDKDSKTVTINQAALQDMSVTLTPSTGDSYAADGVNYKIAVGSDVDLPGAKIQDSTVKISDVTKDDTTGTVTATIQAKLDKSWQNAVSGQEITFTAAETGENYTDVATVTGLNGDITAGGTNQFGITKDSSFAQAIDVSATSDVTTFKLQEGSLTNSDVTITPTQTNNKETFKLAFDDATDSIKLKKYGIGVNFGAAAGTVGFEPIYYWQKTSATTTAYLKADRAEGWTLGNSATGKENDKVTYTAEAKTGQIVATITNLQKNVVAEDFADDAAYTAANDATKALKGTIRNKIEGITLNEASSGNYRFDKITLDKGVLTTTVSAPTTLTVGKELGQTAADAKSAYSLAINSTNGNAGFVPTSATTDTPAWTSLGNTATYKTVTTGFWTIDPATNKVTYTAQVDGKTLFTLKGLNPNVTEADIEVTAPSGSTPGTIQLNANALNNSNVTLTDGKDKDGNAVDYKLVLFTSDAPKDAATTVPQATLTNAKWSISGTTASYKADIAKGYEVSLDGNTVIYTPAGTNKEILKVSGLKSGLSVSNDYSYIGVKEADGTFSSEGLKIDTLTGTYQKTIKLNSSVLGTTNVSLTNGTGVSLGANYTLDIDISDEAKTAGVDVPTTTAKVGTGTTEAPEVAAKFDGGTAPGAVDVWRVSGTNNTTATYKNVVPLYYTINTGSRGITYHAEDTTKTYATVKGLAKGLAVTADGTGFGTVDDAGNVTSVVSIADGTGAKEKLIKLKGGAFAAKTIEVEQGNDKSADAKTYKLAFDTDTLATSLAPKRDTDAALSFSQDTTTKTTGHLKGTLTDGYTLKTDGSEITYTTKDTNHTFAKITGLKQGLAATDFNGANAGISYTANAETGKVEIKLKAKMLGASNVALDETSAGSGDYTLALDTDVKVTGSTPNENIWAASGTTYTYKTITPDNYALAKQTIGGADKANTAITYTAEKDVGSALATITNLKSGLTTSSDRASLAGVKIGKYTTDGEGVTTFSENSTTQTDGTIIQLSKDALNSGTTNAINLTGATGYKLALTDDAKVTNKTPYFTVSGTTAKYNYDTTAGFVVSSPDAEGTGTTVTYKTATTGNNIVTITGLKSGLSPKSDGSIDGIKFGKMEGGAFKEEAGGKVVQLSKDVLNSATVELTMPTGTTGYTLALEGATDLAPKSDQLALKVNKDGSVTLMNGYTTAGYTGTNGTSTKFTYAAGSGGNDVAKITGLKSGLTAVDGAIEGIDIGSFTTETVDGESVSKFTKSRANNNNAVIRFSKDVLNEKDVEIEPATADGTIGYTLAIKTKKDNDTDATTDLVAEPVYTKAWKVPKKGQATFTETTTAGYTLDPTANSQAITYSDKKTVTTTLSGLSTSIKLVELDTANKDGLNPDGTKVKVAGIDKNNYVKFTAATASAGGSDPDTEEEIVKNEGTFTLGEKLLNKTAVTLTNDKTYGAYTLKLATGVAAENYNDSPQWFKEKNSDTATYSVKTKPGYTVSTDGLKVNYSTKDTYTHYATLKGLNKDIEAENGALAGVSFGAVAEVPTTTTGKDGTTSTTYSYTKQIVLGYEALTSSNVTVEGETKDDVASTDAPTGTAFTNVANLATGGYKAEYILALKESDTNPNADSSNNADSKKWYEAQYATPTWTFNKKQGTATLIGGRTESWEAHKKTAGASTAITTDDVYDDKTIYYTKADPKTLATVSGINVVTKDGVNTVEGLNLDTWSRNNDTSGTTVTEKGTGTIHLTHASLNQKDVTVESASKDYAFTFELEGDVLEPEQKENVWVSDGKGNATYQYTVTEGYTLDATNKTTLTYSAEKTTQLAKLTGLNSKQVKATDADGEATLEGIEVTTMYTPEDKTTGTAAAKGTITLTDASILGKTVKITGDKYQLDLSPEVSTQIAGKQWYLSGTTATYKEYYTTGYNLNDAKTTATQATTEAAGNTVLTIKGLKKGLKIATVNEGIAVSDDNTVAINDTVLGTTKVTLTNGTYIDTNDDNKEKSYEYQFAAEGFTTPEVETPRWGFSKGTANLMQNTTKGFTLGSSDTTKELNDVLTYSAAKNVSIAKVKGLNTALKAFNETTYTDAEGNRVEGNVIGTTKTEKVNGKNTTVLDKAVITFDKDNKIISLSEKAFNKKEVSVSGDGDYKLAFGDMGSTNTYEDQVTKWVVSGTTGSFKQYKPLYYTLNEDQDKITYTKEDSPKDTIFAKVTNLKKNTELTAQAFSTESVTNPNYTVDNKDVGDKGHVLTLYADNLNKKNIALSGNAGYALALGDDVSKSTVTATSSASANSKGTAVLTGTRKAGYELAFGSKSVTYISKDKTNQTVATVTGLKGGAKISASDGVITLDSSNVNKKTLTLTSNLGTVDYTFYATALDTPEVTLRTEANGGTWNLKGSTASVMGAVTDDGYIAAASGKAVTYIKETAKKTKANADGTYDHKDVSIATIKGMTGTDSSSVDSSTKKITLHGNNLDSKVTVSGGAFSVDIDRNFNNASLTGSSAADNISVAGSGLTITGGKGDDYIDLGNGGNNTFVYTNGQGNDVIAGFTPGDDILKVTKGAITVEHDGADAIVKVGTGKIRLTGAYTKDTAHNLEGMNLVIRNNKNVETTYFIPDATTMTYGARPSASNVLLEDSNYSADAANLSNIVEPHVATYTPYDFDSGLSLTKEDKLTSAAVTYSGDTNKK